MKILFTTTCLDYSGAPKMMAWVANQMARKGHDVHIVTFFSDEQARILNEDVTFHSLNMVRGSSRLARNTVGMLKTICKLHKLVDDLKPDVVVSFLDSVGYVYLPIGSLLTKSKFVCSERADPYEWKGIIARVRFALLTFAQGFVFQTHGAQKFFQKSKKIYSNSTVIPNPVIVNEKVIAMQHSIPAAKERDKKIVTVGRLSINQKRQDILLEAFKIFKESHPEYKLVIYGDGSDKGKIQSMIDQMRLSEHVTLAGRTNNVEEEISHARAFVLSSDFEGIPNALIEALSIGVPSVSTDCSPGGAALLMKDGENGFLVQRGDAKAIAEKLSVVVDNDDISDLFSKNGPVVINEFSEDIIADKWESYFKKIVKK